MIGMFKNCLANYKYSTNPETFSTELSRSTISYTNVYIIRVYVYVWSGQILQVERGTILDVFLNSFTDRFKHSFEGSNRVTKTSGDTRKRLTCGLTPHGYYI